MDQQVPTGVVTLFRARLEEGDGLLDPVLRAKQLDQLIEGVLLKDLQAHLQHGDRRFEVVLPGRRAGQCAGQQECQARVPGAGQCAQLLDPALLGVELRQPCAGRCRTGEGRRPQLLDPALVKQLLDVSTGVLGVAPPLGEPPAPVDTGPPAAPPPGRSRGGPAIRPAPLTHPHRTHSSSFRPPIAFHQSAPGRLAVR
ncbi:hypothetical protein OIE71_00420 [Streptomyces sp. NBC_01725]|uniref:hypothetical protein n=1 Tax=Streptomyces sp. NBC_01725 TaxID=2975923 RepID=UPI002E2A24F2|nr:hypothetical protein [Streptomyces sp. NBC_01725]